MEKTILQVLIALILCVCTPMDVFASFGVVTLVYNLVESMIWLLKRIYLNKEKDPSQSSHDFD